MRKTRTKWKTEKCGRCGDPHEGYSGKLDGKGREYVVCGVTGKKMLVAQSYKTGEIDAQAFKDIHLYTTFWEREVKKL